jgi:general secretion pathway protein A
MYTSFFQLEKAPFSLVPDPDCVHLTAQHADVISGLTFGVLDRKGYLVLTGEAGLGKTTALRALAQVLDQSKVQSSLIFAPTLTESEFLELAMINFGLRGVPESKAQRLKILENFLVRSDQEGKISALVVDEAHKLSPELLEEVRLLGNFEGSDHKLLQIVLAGQTELADRLNLPELWQLKQRVAIRLSLRRLDRPGVEDYIRFRWGKAGGSRHLPFTDSALDGIARWSNGIPRLINAICDNSLLVAFSEETRTVGVREVREACEELDLATPSLAAFSAAVSGAGPLTRAVPPLPQRKPVSSEEPASISQAQGWADWRPSLKKWFGMADPQ